MAAGGADQVPVERQAVLQHPVGIAAELHDVDADLARRGDLLPGAQPPGPRRIPRVAARLAAGVQQFGQASGTAPAVLSTLAVADDIAAGRLVEVPSELRLERVPRAVWPRCRELPAPALRLLRVARSQPRLASPGRRLIVAAPPARETIEEGGERMATRRRLRLYVAAARGIGGTLARRRGTGPGTDADPNASAGAQLDPGPPPDSGAGPSARPRAGADPGRGPGSPGRTAALGRGRRTAGWLLAVLAPPLLAVLLSVGGRRVGLPVGLLSFLALTVGVALVGGLWPAVVAAVAGFLLVNWFFTPPLHTFSVAEPANAFALLVFVAVAVAVATVVDVAARRSAQAARARAEATTLSMLATSVLRGEDALPALLERLRETFALRSVALLERTGDAWTPVAAAGPAPAGRPAEADVRVRVTDALTLALDGRVLPEADRRVVAAFAHQAAVALDRRRLAEQARAARRLAEGNRIRTALLAAVSHDLRTPLASIKAAVSSLRSPDVRWDPADEAELLATIEESADRLDRLVANLLDMSRLRTGAVNPLARPVTLDEVIQPALANVSGDLVIVEVPEDLPPVVADPGLLERALANVIENAVRHGGDRPVRITATARDGGIELRVADRGQGVPDAVKTRIFEPFQRLGDRPRGSGVGLGLAVARGFAEAVGGDLRAEDTPGGGLTMVFSLPAAGGETVPGAPPEKERT